METEPVDRDQERLRKITYLAGFLAGVSAIIHLLHPNHGVGKLSVIVSSKIGLIFTHPRPLLFTVSGVAILVGIYLYHKGRFQRLILVAGAVMMATYILFYLAWHLSGHGGFLPLRKPIYHEGVGPVDSLLQHLQNDPLALVSVVTEAVTFVLLTVIFKEKYR
ncbi:MAG: hypothetical protein ABEK59_08010 [Halobacteria archaeon]